MKISPKNLPDDALFVYYSQYIEDANLRSLVLLLRGCCADDASLISYLKKIRDDGCTLLAVYDNKKAPTNAKLIGAIDDGCLYLVTSK